MLRTLGDVITSLLRRGYMRDCRSKLTHNGKSKVHLLLSFHIFDSLVGRVLVKLIECLGKHFPREKSKILAPKGAHRAHVKAHVSFGSADPKARGLWERDIGVRQLTRQGAQVRK